MSDDLFPSGPWVGFYNYQPGERHRMDLHLTFAQGRMSGDGNDDVGRFTICGRYDATTRECHWTKSYLGAHDVFYRGFREGRGIWGTWEIKVFAHGGFHIWPKQAGEAEAESQRKEEPVEAVAPEPLVVAKPQRGGAATEVAQSCTLPYRRFAIGGASELPARPARAPGLQNAILRYGRLKI